MKVKFDESLFDDDYEYFNITYELDQKKFACKAHPLSPSLDIFICIFYLIVFLMAISGNLIVGLVVGSSKLKLGPSDLFLFHLSLADGLLALTLPLWAISVPKGWVFGGPTCRLVSMVLEVNFYTSILFLVCISGDRYMMVVHSTTEHSSWQRGRGFCSWIICAMVWILGVVLSLPATIYNDAYISPAADEKLICGEHYNTSSADAWRFSTRAVSHILGFLIPLVIMAVCYGVTVARLLRTRGMRRQRAMRVIAAVVVAFLLCWCPYHLTVILDTLMRARLVSFDCHGRLSTDHALLATQSLALLHCCINPVLYAFVGEKFRSNLKKLLRRKGVLERASVSRSSRSTSTTSQDGNNALL